MCEVGWLPIVQVFVAALKCQSCFCIKTTQSEAKASDITIQSEAKASDVTIQSEAKASDVTIQSEAKASDVMINQIYSCGNTEMLL